jgi:hypothetical protein
MKNLPPLAVRGYLLHLTHYDPRWVLQKSTEKPFDLKVGMGIVDALAATGFNTLLIGVSDGVRYASHPELRRRYSVPMKQLVQLASHARESGLDVVPKLNFSRSEVNCHDFWLRGPGQQWYDEFDDDAYWKKGFECIDEVIGACRPSRYFHVGMDEDHNRSCAQYAEAIRTLRAGLKKRGLRTVTWSDSALEYASGQVYAEKSRMAEETVPRDVIRLLWNYSTVPRAAIRAIRANGRELWGAPGSRVLEQAEGFRDELKRAGGRGIVMTRWVACRPENRQAILKQIRQFGPVYCG